jgi:hypothetical protein
LTVFTAFEEDQFYVLTHPEALGLQEARVKNILNLSKPG